MGKERRYYIAFDRRGGRIWGLGHDRGTAIDDALGHPEGPEPDQIRTELATERLSQAARADERRTDIYWRRSGGIADLVTLRSCPYCDCNEVGVQTDDSRHLTRYWVGCPGCDARGSSVSETEGADPARLAIAAWNHVINPVAAGSRPERRKT